MRVLVTGGAGFLGAPLVKRLVDFGYRVTVIDNLSRGKKDNLGRYLDQIEFIIHDMKQPLDFMIKYDVVFDLAARVFGITKLYDNQPRFLRENLLILLNSLESLKDNMGHYFYFSSSCVYNYVGCPHPHKETDARVLPRTGYDLSKLFGMEIARIYAEKYGFKYTAIIPFNVYGLGESLDGPHVITDFFTRLLIEKKDPTGLFWMLGNGSQTRSFTYIDDFIDGLMLLMEKESEGIFNIGSTEETSIGHLLRTMFSIAELPYGNYSLEFRKGYYEDVQRRQPDTSKIRMLGWKPKHDLVDGLGEIWRELTIESA